MFIPAWLLMGLIGFFFWPVILSFLVFLWYMLLVIIALPFMFLEYITRIPVRVTKRGLNWYSGIYAKIESYQIPTWIIIPLGILTILLIIWSQ